MALDSIGNGQVIYLILELDGVGQPFGEPLLRDGLALVSSTMMPLMDQR